MRKESRKELIQWIVAAVLALGGVAVLVYGPSAHCAGAQEMQSDPVPLVECS